MGLMDMNLGDIGAAALTQAAYTEGKQGLSDFAKQAQEGQQQAWQQFSPSFEFKPFTVTTSTGATTGYDPTTGLTMQGSAQEQALQNQMLQGAQGMYGGATQDVSGRAQDIYGSMLTAMQPEMERQRLQNEQRALAQGQMGLQSNMYGGTDATTFGMNRAQQEAMNNAYLQARQNALGEQQQMANIGSSMFTQAYLPQAQQLQALQAAQNAAQMEQTARQQYGTTGMESYLAGLNAQLQANLGKSNLTQGYMSSLADIFRPTVNPVTGNTISGTGLLGGVTFGDIAGWFGGSSETNAPSSLSGLLNYDWGSNYGG